MRRYRPANPAAEPGSGMTGKGASEIGDPMAHLRAMMGDWPGGIGPGTDEALVRCLDQMHRPLPASGGT